MKCVTNDLNVKGDLRIEIFSDLHIGSKKCDEKLIRERIKQVAENKNTYCILLGDIINNSTRDSVGDVYEEPLSPMQQIKHALMLFEPIKDKILGVCSGNHERRSYKKEGVDLLYFFCSELGITDKYDYCSCLLFIKFGRGNGGKNTKGKDPKKIYTLYMTHGDGSGGRTIGGKANGLQRRGDIIDADIVVTGHTHAPITFREKHFVVDRRYYRTKIHEVVFVNASSALDYEEYAEIQGMKPSSKVSPVIVLSDRGWEDHDVSVIF